MSFDYKNLNCLQGHTSFVTHLDWSEDSHQLRSNSGDYEVLYCKWLRNCYRDRGNITSTKISMMFRQYCVLKL